VALAFSAPRANQRFIGLHSRGADAIVVENPQGVDTSELRKSLVPALLAARVVNVRNGVATTDLFSIGRTFSSSGHPREIDAVAGLIAGPRRLRGVDATAALSFWHVKWVVEAVAAAHGCRAHLRWVAATGRSDLHPRAGAEIRRGDEALGYAGEVHPDALAELDLNAPVFVYELDLARLGADLERLPRYRPVPRFPASSRDISLVVPLDLPAERIVEVARGVNDPLLEHIEAFDEYLGEGVEAGKRALAFTLRYRAADRTMTDEEVAAAHERVLTRVLSALPVRLRA
jgi:phenylalanyl-tRNA synthetase beta chain